MNQAAGENHESNGKKIKAEEAFKKEMDAVKGKAEAKDDTKDANQKQKNDNSKPPEPPKDYIHVRARRGQATDSHSLAERVRAKSQMLCISLFLHSNLKCSQFLTFCCPLCRFDERKSANG